jgi:hypothetical protein
MLRNIAESPEGLLVIFPPAFTAKQNQAVKAMQFE